MFLDNFLQLRTVKAYDDFERCGYPSKSLLSAPTDLAASNASLGVDEERRQNERGER